MQSRYYIRPPNCHRAAVGGESLSGPRVYRGLEELTYPFHDGTFTVTQCGRIQVGERIWLVTFTHDVFGLFRRYDVPAGAE